MTEGLRPPLFSVLAALAFCLVQCAGEPSSGPVDVRAKDSLPHDGRPTPVDSASSPDKPAIGDVAEGRTQPTHDNIVEAPSDTLQDLATPFKDVAQPCEPGPIDECEIHFFMEATQPLPQSFVWLTGSFTDWAESPSAGAIEMQWDDGLPGWRGIVPMPDNTLVQYKYLMGWEDNPGPEWVTKDWNFESGFGNTVLLAKCGEKHCDGEMSFLRQPWFQWPEDGAFWIMADTNLNMPLTFSITADGFETSVSTEPYKENLHFPVLPLDSPDGYRHKVKVVLPSETASVKVKTVVGPAFETELQIPQWQEQLNLVVYGDTRTQADKHQMVIDAAAQEHPHAVLVVGDLVAEGLSLWQWQEFMGIEQQLLSSSFVFPVFGNHDVAGGLGDAFVESWFHTENRYVSGGNYWIDLGLVGLVVIENYNVSWDKPEALQWLESVLANLADKDWLILSFHEPYLSFSGHDQWQDGWDYIRPLVQDYGVDMVLAGHNHLYEHFLMDGVHYITAGGGGAPLSEVGAGPPDQQQYFVAAGSIHSYMRMDITKEKIKCKVIKAEDGSFFEDFEIQ